MPTVRQDQDQDHGRALTRDLSQGQLDFQVEGRDPNEFQVIRYRGTEGLCQLYRFENIPQFRSQTSRLL